MQPNIVAIVAATFDSAIDLLEWFTEAIGEDIGIPNETSPEPPSSTRKFSVCSRRDMERLFVGMT